MMRRSLGTVVLSLVLTCALLTGCVAAGGGIGASGPVIPDEKEDVAEAAARLADELAGASSAEEALPAVLEVLARNGVEVRSVDGTKEIARPLAATGAWADEYQAGTFASDQVAGLGQSMSGFATELAECPETTGTAYPADVAQWTEMLLKVLPAWTEVAHERPDEQGAFAALFLEAMGKKHDPAVDYAKIDDPAQVQLSSLELFVLTSGFAIPADSAQSSSAVQIMPWESAAFAADPARPSTEDELKTVGTKIGKEAASKAAKAAVEKAYGEDAAKLFGKITKAIGWAGFLASLAAMYGGYGISISADTDKIHYIHPGDENAGGPKQFTYTAQVTSKPLMDPGLQSALSLAGAKMPDEKSAKNAVVRWTFDEGTPEHAQPQQASAGGDKGGSVGRFEAHVDADGKTTLKMDTSWEKSRDTRKYGKIKKGRIVVRAEAFTQGMTGGQILGSLLTLGTKDALKAWADRWFPKTATHVLPVEYHAKKNYKYKGTYSVGSWTIVEEGKSRDGLYGLWDITWTATMSRDGYTSTMTTKGTATTIEGSDGLFRAEGTIKSHLDLEGMVMDQNGTVKSSGTARIEGTQDAPSITLTTKEFNMATSDSGTIDGEGFSGGFGASGSDGSVSGGGKHSGSSGWGSSSIASAFKSKPRTYKLEPAD